MIQVLYCLGDPELMGGKWGDLKGRRDMGVIVSSTQSL